MHGRRSILKALLRRSALLPEMSPMDYVECVSCAIRLQDQRLGSCDDIFTRTPPLANERAITQTIQQLQKRAVHQEYDANGFRVLSAHVLPHVIQLWCSMKDTQYLAVLLDSIQRLDKRFFFQSQEMSTAMRPLFERISEDRTVDGIQPLCTVLMVMSRLRFRDSGLMKGILSRVHGGISKAGASEVTALTLTMTKLNLDSTDAFRLVRERIWVIAKVCTFREATELLFALSNSHCSDRHQHTRLLELLLSQLTHVASSPLHTLSILPFQIVMILQGLLKWKKRHSVVPNGVLSATTVLFSHLRDVRRCGFLTTTQLCIFLRFITAMPPHVFPPCGDVVDVHLQGTKLDKCTFTDLVQLTAGLGAAGHGELYDKLMEKAHSVLITTPHQTDPADACMLLASMAKHCRTRRAAPLTVSAAMTRVGTSHLESLEPHFCTMFVSAVSTLRMATGREPNLRRVLLRLIGLGPTVPQESLSKALNSLTREKYDDRAIIEKLLKNAADAASRVNPGTRVLVLNLHSMVRRRIENEPIYRIFADLLADVPDMASAQDVSMTVYAVTRLFPESDASQRLLRQILTRFLPPTILNKQLSPLGASHILTSLSRCSKASSNAEAIHKSVHSVVDYIVEKGPTKFTPRQISVVLYSLHKLGRLQERTSDLVEPALSYIATLPHETSLKLSVIFQLYLTAARCSPPHGRALQSLQRRMTPHGNLRDLLWYLYASVRLKSYDAAYVQGCLQLHHNIEDPFGPRAAFALGCLGRLRAQDIDVDILLHKLSRSEAHLLSAPHIAAAMMGLAYLQRQSKKLIRKLLEQVMVLPPGVWVEGGRGRVVLQAMDFLGVTCEEVHRRLSDAIEGGREGQTQSNLLNRSACPRA